MPTTEAVFKRSLSTGNACGKTVLVVVVVGVVCGCFGHCMTCVYHHTCYVSCVSFVCFCVLFVCCVFCEWLLFRTLYDVRENPLHIYGVQLLVKTMQTWRRGSTLPWTGASNWQLNLHRCLSSSETGEESLFFNLFQTRDRG